MSSRKAAEWMQAEIEQNYSLSQGYAAMEIERIFGEQFVYVNRNFNRAIIKDVLGEFAKITGDTVVWIHQSRKWRKRESFDSPGRRQ